MNTKQKFLSDAAMLTKILETKKFPSGTFTALANKYGVSRERVRQIAMQSGYVITSMEEIFQCVICHKEFSTYNSYSHRITTCEKHRGMGKNFYWKMHQPAWNYPSEIIRKKLGTEFTPIHLMKVMGVYRNMVPLILSRWMVEKKIVRIWRGVYKVL